MSIKYILSVSAVVLALLAGATQLPVSTNALSASALQQGIPSLAPMLREVTPAVVSIRTSRRVNPDRRFLFNRRVPEELQRYFDFNRESPLQDRQSLPRRQGAGSGVIIDAQQGYIVTNHHVVEEADQIDVTLQDGRRFIAQPLGSDEGTDIALLKIEADNLQALDFADSDSAAVGDFVVAVGNPFGIGQTVTAGIISALDRSGIDNDRYEDFIQTDAAINVGNSGGALVDMEGRLLGINAAIISSNGGGSDGIGFAVPSNMVSAVLEHLERDGEVRRGVLGVQISDNSPQLAQTLELASSSGALVTRVLPDSAAEVAGIKVYDIITAIDEKPVSSGRELRNLVGLIRQGAAVQLDVLRGTTELSLTATIGNSSGPTVAEESTARLPVLFAGASLATATNGNSPAGVEVLVVDPGSRAARAGLQAGDVIIEINRQSVLTLQQFNQQADEADGLMALTVLRGQRPLLIVFS